MFFIAAIIIAAIIIVIIITVIVITVVVNVAVAFRTVIVIIWHYNPLLSIFIHYSGAEYLLTLTF